jgi:hypothetical protein
MSTKTCSNNMVSPNDHVVMNHQNQTPNKWHMRPCSLQPRRRIRPLGERGGGGRCPPPGGRLAFLLFPGPCSFAEVEDAALDLRRACHPCVRGGDAPWAAPVRGVGADPRLMSLKKTGEVAVVRSAGSRQTGGAVRRRPDSARAITSSSKGWRRRSSAARRAPRVAAAEGGGLREWSRGGGMREEGGGERQEEGGGVRQL